MRGTRNEVPRKPSTRPSNRPMNSIPISTYMALAAILAGAIALLYLLFLWRFERWKSAFEKDVRKDAVRRSQATTVGMVSEQLVPYFPEFPWNPKDARFIGSPVDFLVFDGLTDERLRAVVFVEVKAGPSASLTRRERQVRDAVAEGRVEWVELKVPTRATS